MLREALASLYALFDITRGILRKYGPEVAKSKGEGQLSFGYLSVVVLNGVLRPLLAKWHPMLADHEAHRGTDVAMLEHEAAWDHADELRNELSRARQALSDYADVLADVLADVANVRPLRWPEPGAASGASGGERPG